MDGYYQCRIIIEKNLTIKELTDIVEKQPKIEQMGTLIKCMIINRQDRFREFLEPFKK